MQNAITTVMSLKKASFRIGYHSITIHFIINDNNYLMKTFTKNIEVVDKMNWYELQLLYKQFFELLDNSNIFYKDYALSGNVSTASAFKKAIKESLNI